jgi:hypothetical protein
VTIRSDGNLVRFVPPPAPTPPEWHVSEATAGGAPAPPAGLTPAGSAASFTYSMTPLTDAAVSTPPIPFSTFDPKRGAYVDLTIPAVPIRVESAELPVDWQALIGASLVATNEEKRLTLSELAARPGHSGRLVPLPRRGGLVAILILPVLLFFGLWNWDRWRRYLEQHPDVVWRRRARRALRREKRALRSAFQSGDAPLFAGVAVRAMRVAAAPHFPAEPRALVGGDILNLLGTEKANDERVDTVRRFFAAADASQFSGSDADAGGLLKLRPELECVLEELEARL